MTAQDFLSRYEDYTTEDISKAAIDAMKISVEGDQVVVADCMPVGYCLMLQQAAEVASVKWFRPFDIIVQAVAQKSAKP